MSTQQILTIIGLVLMKLGTGLMGTWGNNNIYFLSYFYHKGYQVSAESNSYIMLTIFLPMTIIGLFATKISVKWGYQNTMKACAWIFLISPLLAAINFTPISMTIFCLFIPASCFAISVIPLMNCLFTQFPEYKNKISSLTVIVFVAGQIFWNFYISFMVNPQNASASVQANEMKFFQAKITQNLLKYGLIMYVSSGLLFVLGSYLVKRRVNQQQGKSRKYWYKDSPISTQERAHIRKKKNSQQSFSTAQQDQTQSITLIEAILDRRFLIIIGIAYLLNLYQSYLLPNLKIVFFNIINDDHFFTYGNNLHSTAAVLGAVFWGFIGDKYGFKNTVVILCTLDFLFKVYGNFAATNTTLSILFLALGFTDKGMITIIGPGLVDTFGLHLGTQLLPFKAASAIMGFVSVAILNIILSKFFNSHQFLKILSYFTSFALVLSFVLKNQLTKLERRQVIRNKDQLQEKDKNSYIDYDIQVCT